MARLFQRGPTGTVLVAEEDLRQAYEKIGRLDVELDWLKKNWGQSIKWKRPLIDRHDPMVSIQQQCALLGLSRSAYYYIPPQRARRICISCACWMNTISAPRFMGPDG